MIEEEQELATIKKPNDPPEVVSNEEYERRIREIIKCKRDIVYFAEKYFRIVSLDKGLTTIQLYEKQKDMLRHFVDNDRSIVCASRQIGKCVSFWTKIKIRHRKWKFSITIPIGIFYCWQKLLSVLSC